ncbi:unnamed protein product [Heligmosomoides polygyrus]|uniref:LITAF domain-containing protein n=1 Tax=Heligmosomoides polygyrus TaxID=6339 RepID=A0A3P8AH76_HELPZ|nr:unnamed protein product [Heligmosomoides polygyrus]
MFVGLLHAAAVFAALNTKPPLLLSEELSVHDSCDLTQCEQEGSRPSSHAGKTFMVMPEDIEAAGLSMHNLNELTEEQFNNLVMIAERRQSGADSAASSTLQQREPYDFKFTPRGQEVVNCVATPRELVDADFSGDQLAALRIDVNNLTDDSIQQIVQLAMPAINIGGENLGLPKADVDRPRRGPAMVQYEDGRFEWVGEESVDLCEVKRTQHSDHSGYHAGGLPQEDESPTTILLDAQHMKRPGSTETVFDVAPSPAKRRAVAPSPNFCCPVCDRKVYQKEPSYIVIRLPACDDCTKERMIVLDERLKKGNLVSRQK